MFFFYAKKIKFFRNYKKKNFTSQNRMFNEKIWTKAAFFYIWISNFLYYSLKSTKSIRRVYNFTLKYYFYVSVLTMAYSLTRRSF